MYLTLKSIPLGHEQTFYDLKDGQVIPVRSDGEDVLQIKIGDVYGPSGLVGTQSRRINELADERDAVQTAKDTIVERFHDYREQSKARIAELEAQNVRLQEDKKKAFAKGLNKADARLTKLQFDLNGLEKIYTARIRQLERDLRESGKLREMANRERDKVKSQLSELEDKYESLGEAYCTTFGFEDCDNPDCEGCNELDWYPEWN